MASQTHEAHGAFRQNADGLHEFEQAIFDYCKRKPMNWIKISEQRPPLDVGVLVTDGNVVTCVHVGEFEPGGKMYFTGHMFGGWEWEWDFDTDKITHWAQLPEPPK